MLDRNARAEQLSLFLVVSGQVQPVVFNTWLSTSPFSEERLLVVPISDGIRHSYGNGEAMSSSREGRMDILAMTTTTSGALSN